MNWTKKGSALVYMMFFISIILLLSSIILHNSALIDGCALVCYRTLKKQYAYDSLGTYAIAYCKNLDKMRQKLSQKEREKEHKESIVLDNWFDLGKKGSISICAQNNSYTITYDYDSFDQKSLTLIKEHSHWRYA